MKRLLIGGLTAALLAGGFALTTASPASANDVSDVHHPECAGLVKDIAPGDPTPIGGIVYVKASTDHLNYGYKAAGYIAPTPATNGHGVSHVDVCPTPPPPPPPVCGDDDWEGDLPCVPCPYDSAIELDDDACVPPPPVPCAEGEFGVNEPDCEPPCEYDSEIPASDGDCTPPKCADGEVGVYPTCETPTPPPPPADPPAQIQVASQTPAAPAAAPAAPAAPAPAAAVSAIPTQLPSTGSSSWALALIALVTLMGGTGLVRLSRRPTD